MKDSKYVVIKAADITWRDHPSKDGKEEFPRTATITESDILKDARVIRDQDAFAAPALWAYANTIGLFAGQLFLASKDTTDESTRDQLLAQARQLQGIADYFSESAESAAHAVTKLPD